MGNSSSSLQERIFSHVKRGEYHPLKILLDQLQQNHQEYRRSPSLYLDARDAEGNTPLLIAASKGFYQVSELLLQRGADISIQNNSGDGGSPLHEAIQRRHEHIIALLLRYHANPFVENSKSFTALDFACQTRNVDLLRRLEIFAPWRGWLELKVPVFGGLGTEWKRRWVVIAHRIPSPWAPPNRKRTHVSLICYKSTNDTSPDCRVWLDGATAVEEPNPRALQRTNGRTPAQMELKLHRIHSPPTGCFVSGTPQAGYSLHFRPDEGSYGGCNELRQWAQVVNNRGQQQQQQVSTPAPIVPQGSGGSSSSGAAANPQYSPLSQGASGGVLHPAGGSGNIRPISQPSQDVGVLMYPAIQFAQPGSGTNSPAAAAAAGAGAHRMSSFGTPPPPPLATNTPNMISASVRPSAPMASTLPPQTAAVVPPPPQLTAKPAMPAAIASVDEDKMCIICCSEPYTHAFFHGTTSHLCICKACAEDYAREGRNECPICRERSSIVHVFIS